MQFEAVCSCLGRCLDRYGLLLRCRRCKKASAGQACDDEDSIYVREGPVVLIEDFCRFTQGLADGYLEVRI